MMSRRSWMSSRMALVRLARSISSSARAGAKCWSTTPYGRGSSSMPTDFVRERQPQPLHQPARRDQHLVPARDALDLDEIARPEVADARCMVERDHTAISRVHLLAALHSR